MALVGEHNQTNRNGETKQKIMFLRPVLMAHVAAPPIFEMITSPPMFYYRWQQYKLYIHQNKRVIIQLVD
jgi:hypothetical protein